MKIEGADDKGQQFWFKIGGRLISIQAGTLYARDCGKFNSGAKGAPAALNQSPDGFKKKIDISYSGLYSHLLDSNPMIDSKATAAAMRDIMKGAAASDNYWPLPLLASVMFLSEVARNHTAFHSGLMMLDLIEKGVSIDTSQFQYNLANCLWSPQMIDAIVSKKETKGIAVATEDKDAKLNPIQAGSEKTLIEKGMGMGVMSHQFSESGGAFDLEGGGSYRGAKLPKEGDAPMTLTRRKEATLLIRWVSIALKSAHPKLKVGVGSDNVKFDYSKAYDFADYFDDDKAKGMLDLKYVLPLLLARADTLDCMIVEPKL